MKEKMLEKMKYLIATLVINSEQPELLEQPLMELRSLVSKLENSEPTVYLTVHKGMITEVHSTEKIILSVQDRDNLEQVNQDDVAIWEHMIEQGLDSGELVEIPC